MVKSLRRTYLLGALFVLALTALFAFANWHWLRANTVTYGWDRLDHLITSFVYRDTLAEVTPRSLLAALSYSDYYPPLVHYGSVLLYRLFGVDEDIAPMVNVFYMAILLGATFWIAARWRHERLYGDAAAHGRANAHVGVRTGRGAGVEPQTGGGRADAHVGVRTGRGAVSKSLAVDWPVFWTGALAAMLLGLFPIVFAMSRYLYLDFALTALVAASVALLLASDRFDRCWPSLAFGLALGLSFLVKWTTAAFLFGPLLYIILRSGVLPYAWRHPRSLLPNFKRLALSLAAATAVVVFWFALAQDIVTSLPLGWWLAVPLSLLLGGVLYTLFGTSRRGEEGALRLRHMLGAGTIAAFLIALWYLTNAEFINHFLFTAYGREDEPFYAFAKYLREVVNEQLGPWFTLVFLAVLATWAWQSWHHARSLGPGKPSPSSPLTSSAPPTRGSQSPLPPSSLAGRSSTPGPVSPATPVAAAARARIGLSHVSDIAWVLLLWVLVSYFIFSFRVTLAHSRFLMPFLPPFAIWMAVGLMQWRPRPLRLAAVTIVLAVAVAQYALITFDELAPWRTPLRVEVAGQPINLLANGFFIQYPTSGVTDSGYGVAPEILAYVDGQRLPGGALEGKEVAHLGLLVNSYQLHEKHFLYSIYKDFPNVRLRELARNWSEQPAYNQLFDMDYVLVSDTHTFRTGSASQLAVQRILNDGADAFNMAFVPVQQWTLPSGEQLTLYGRRFQSLEPGVSPGDYQQLLAFFGDRLGPGDAVILVSPDQVYMLGLSLPSDAGAAIVPLPVPGESETQLLARLQVLAATHNRIFLVSHNAEQVDPYGVVEIWLRANTVAANDFWAGAVRVTPFVPLASSMAAVAPNTSPNTGSDTGEQASDSTGNDATGGTGEDTGVNIDGDASGNSSENPGGTGNDVRADDTGNTGVDVAKNASENAGGATAADAGTTELSGEPLLLGVDAWQDGPTLELASVTSGGRAPTPTAGGALVVTLRWTDVGDTPLKASLQLLAPDGLLAAQEDRDLSPGEQQFVLLIPRSAAAADYQLGLVLYDPANGQRLVTTGGAEMALLGTIPITPAAVPAPVAFPPLRHPDDATDEGS